MIEFKHINKKFGRFQVLDEITLSIGQGVCAVLIGPNGCGKTTLLKTMLNMVIPDSGSVSVDRTDVKESFESRKNIGFMPQIGYFPENMTVNQIIDTIKAIRHQRDRIDNELYEQFDIRAFEHKKMGTLSGGMIQKVSATIAFMFDPQIIIMDEPFAGLDILAAAILKEKILKEKEKGKTILMTSHTFGEIDGIVSHVILMDNGKILFYKPLEELLSSTGESNVTEAVIRLLN